jgi:hypothetical protein
MGARRAIISPSDINAKQARVGNRHGWASN